MVARARVLHAKGFSAQAALIYLMRAIEHTHRGLDVEHYRGRTKGSTRRNYTSDTQAHVFLKGCRELIPFPINRLGHSAELGFKVSPYEFRDEKRLHMEVFQPFDRLEVDSSSKFA
jgi:hypothetical protein